MLTDHQKRVLNRAVRTGAETLDQKYPTWFKRIDLDSLNLADCSACIAGQLGEKYLGENYDGFSSFSGFVRKLIGRLSRKRVESLAGRLDEDGSIYWGDVADALGFDVPTQKTQFYYMDEAYRYLDHAWLREINRRKKRAAA